MQQEITETLVNFKIAELLKKGQSLTVRGYVHWRFSAMRNAI